MMRILIITVTSLVMPHMALNAHAKDSAASTNTTSPLSFIYKCAEIADSTKRLNCYDTNISTLRLAEKNEEIIAIDIDTAKQIKREAFGFSLPSLGALKLPQIGKDEKVDSIVLGVKSIRTQGSRYVITMENGQVWKETGGHLTRLPKGKLTATIKPKALGSFLLILDNGHSRKRNMRARRVK